MRPHIVVDGSRAAYGQIVDEIRRAVIVGNLSSGEALPSARALAIDLGINPNTVKHAYQELVREGVAYVRRGHGTYISERQRFGERHVIVREVAARASREAARHGMTPQELIEAIRASES